MIVDDRKFHLDDPAQRDDLGTVYFPITTDPDTIFRPWRYAHHNPIPNLVLFPHTEHALRWTKDTRSEIAYRIKTAVAVLRGDAPDGWR